MNTQTKTKCATCGGECRVGKTTFTAEFGVGIVVVRKVPATICTQCGEDWIDDETAERLEKMVTAAKKSGRQIEVSEFVRKVG